MLVFEFAWVSSGILGSGHNRLFLGAIPFAALALLGSAYLLWKIPRFWRWVVAAYFVIVILSTFRGSSDASVPFTWASLLNWAVIVVLALLTHALTAGKPVQAFLRDLASQEREGYRRRELIVGIPSLFVIVACVAGYTVHLARMMKPILESPGIQVEATPFEPVKVPVTRRIDLGYARLSLPATMRGDPALVNPNGMLAIGTEPSYTLIFLPLQGDGEIPQFLHSLPPFSGQPTMSWFDLKKLEVAQKPFSVWQVPIMGRADTNTATALISLKALEFGTTSSAGFYEDGRLGMVVLRGTNVNELFIEDLKARIVLRILVKKSIPNLDDVASAVLGNFELNVASADPAVVLGAITAAGIASSPTPLAAIKPPPPPEP